MKKVKNSVNSKKAKHKKRKYNTIIIKTIFSISIIILILYWFYWSYERKIFYDKEKDYIQILEKIEILDKKQNNKEYKISFNIIKLKEESEKISKDLDSLKEEYKKLYDCQYQNYLDKQKNQNELENIAKNLNLDVDIDKCEVKSFENKLTLDEVEKLKKSLSIIENNLNNIKKTIDEFIKKREDNNQFVNPLWLKNDKDLKEMIKELEIEEKAGQLLMFGFDGKYLSDNQKNQFKKLGLGGVIIMGDNVKNSEQLEKLTNKIQKTNNKIPLFVSVDQEGGAVKRIKWDDTPGQEKWFNKSDEELCNIGKKRAQVLKKVGININFSPVADLKNLSKSAFINKRTISKDPSLVSEKIKSYIKCHQEEKVFTTIKHFPGHGSTIEDSHFVLPQIEKEKEEWEETDLIPFKENLDSKLIMVGHLSYKNLDKNEPASQSKEILTNILRKELNYEGLIITDAMGQLHLSTGVSVKMALKKAFNAGVDIVLYVGVPTSKENIKKTLVDLIKNNEIDSTIVDRSLLRILKLKREII